jgi:hypothetical protein
MFKTSILGGARFEAPCILIQCYNALGFGGFRCHSDFIDVVWLLLIVSAFLSECFLIVRVCESI